MPKYFIGFVFCCLQFNQALLAQQTTQKQQQDSLSIADLQYLRKTSSMLKDLEDSLGINAANMSKKVQLVPATELKAIEINTAIIKVPFTDDLNSALFAYAHNMYNAIHVSAYKAVIAKARKLTRTAFADSLCVIESKAVYNTILIGLETGTTQYLPYPTNLINAVIDKVKRKINTATVLYMAFNYVKNNAKDANGKSIYQSFTQYYDGLPR